MFDRQQSELGFSSECVHPEFRKLTAAHNKLILEMRRDALGWSVFHHPGVYTKQIEQRFRLPVREKD